MRARLEDEPPLRLAEGFRLDASACPGGVLLTGSGGAVQLNAVAAAILALCDGTRNAAGIAQAAARAAAAPEADREDVMAFLSMAQAVGWVRPA
ncbi:MAG TPA: pyrroloquinoline quinone biosynthesis peptide chaperone PqqD [Nevskiaceae bacterium]|nr:pyrroloquinoline quinone biosynthesis peptide chaperone PqqD [Nevskiaceae bacterium]